MPIPIVIEFFSFILSKIIFTSNFIAINCEVDFSGAVKIRFTTTDVRIAPVLYVVRQCRKSKLHRHFRFSS